METVAETIWNYLRKTFNAYATAGIMGNLFYESGLNPKNLSNSKNKSFGMTDDEYVAAVDNGTYTNFVHDGGDFGLAQWQYYSRKQNLLNFAKQQKTSIGNLQMQLDFLIKELTGNYKSSCGDPLKTVTSVKQASDIILTKFERPANQSDSIKNKRATKGQEYYNLYNNPGSDVIVPTIYEKYINSTGIHYISNSGSDENKQYKGGTAGDQTGNEWQLKAWYNRPWTVVLRYPNQAIALIIAQLSIDAALNNKIGYDQNQRTTYWKQLQLVGYQPSKITTACEQDCTAGVSSNVKAAGYLCNIETLKNITICSSRDMKSIFTKAGFQVLTDSKYLTNTKYLLPGDILLYEGHHAAANVTIGSAVRNIWKPENIVITDITPMSYKLGDRTLQQGDSGNDVKELQQKLMALGFSLPKYGADGSYGNETINAVKNFQKKYNLTIDGIFGPKSYQQLLK